MIDAAQRMARAFDASAPAEWLERHGISLRVVRRPLRLPGRTVYGAWDPLLRRIELFGTERPDAELVASLGHELHHTREAGEAGAEAFAAAWVAALGPSRTGQCAAALRRLPGAEPGADAAVATGRSGHTRDSSLPLGLCSGGPALP